MFASFKDNVIKTFAKKPIEIEKREVVTSIFFRNSKSPKRQKAYENY